MCTPIKHAHTIYTKIPIAKSHNIQCLGHVPKALVLRGGHFKAPLQTAQRIQMSIVLPCRRELGEASPLSCLSPVSPVGP